MPPKVSVGVGGNEQTFDLDRFGKNQELLPSREQFKDKPGYYERPAKVMRTGVGMVDGYEWGYTYKANDGHGKLTNAAHEVGEMFAPHAVAEDSRQVAQTGLAKRWEPRMRCKGKTLMVQHGGKLYRAVNGEWVPV